MVDIENHEVIEPEVDEPVNVASPPEAEVEEPSAAKPSSNNPWVLLIVGLIVGGLAGFYFRPIVLPEPDPAAAAPLAAVADSGQMNKPDPHKAVMLAVTAGARHFQGDPNAPVTIIEFGDFNCGYCGKWTYEVLPRIQEKYINTGKARMAFVHYPILGDDSMTAARGTECAAKQDKFWEYHNIVYGNQGIGFTPVNLTNLAKDLGLDQASFESCLANFKDQPIIDDDIRLAQVMGVRGTPAFLVNGIPLAGAYPYEDFETIIEGTLAGKF